MADTSKSKRKNAPGNRSDFGWEHGVEVNNNPRKIKCKYCEKIISGNIYRLKHHLACTRRDVEACKAVPDDVKQQIISIMTQQEQVAQSKKRVDQQDEEDTNVVNDNISKKKGKTIMESFGFSATGKKVGNTQSTMNQIFKKDLREEACQQIARFFYTSSIPFNCVKNPEFIKIFDFVARYGIGFKPPSYHEIRETFLKKEIVKTMDLLESHKLEWKRTGCTIMSDGWTDRKRRSIYNFLVNSPKGTIFLSSVDTSNISKTADKVFEILDDIVEKVGEENVVQIITDNAANYKAAGEMLMEKRKSLFWTPCAAHCLDLILEDFEKKLSIHRTTIAKGKKICTFIYSRTMLISMLRHFTKGKDLIRLATTRFATLYLTLSSLSDSKGALMTMFTSNQWKSSKFSRIEEGKKMQQSVLDSSFWKNVIICLKAALPIIRVLRMVDSDEKPAMGFIYEEMDRAKEKIQLNFNSVKKRYEPIWQIIDERWDVQLHRPLHVAGYYLNPQFHYGPTFKPDAEVKRGLYSCLVRMVPDPEERFKIDMQLEDFKDAKGLFGISPAIMTRDKKLPAKWWDSYGDECPELKRFAIRILSLTCSSSGCERNWSVFEQVHSKRRNRLHQKKMNDLVFIKHNLKLNVQQDKRKTLEDISFEELSSDEEWITNKHVDSNQPSCSKKEWLGALNMDQESDDEGEQENEEASTLNDEIDEEINQLDEEIVPFDDPVLREDEIEEIGDEEEEEGEDDNLEDDATENLF